MNGHAHDRGSGIDLGRAREALQALPPDLPERIVLLARPDPAQ